MKLSWLGRLQLTALLVSIAGACPAAAEDLVRDLDAAARLVEESVRRDKVYERVDCLSFEPSEDETDSRWAYSVEIREIHQGKCAREGLDPNVAPLIDTFLVARDGRLFWYDFTADDVVRSYKQFLAERSKKN